MLVIPTFDSEMTIVHFNFPFYFHFNFPFNFPFNFQL